MSEYEYNKRLQWYKDYIDHNYNSSSRRVREYCDYLHRWFSEERCDGVENYFERTRRRLLPMAYNIYFN